VAAEVTPPAGAPGLAAAGHKHLADTIMVAKTVMLQVLPMVGVPPEAVAACSGQSSWDLLLVASDLLRQGVLQLFLLLLRTFRV
jgi:hypothetical protein